MKAAFKVVATHRQAKSKLEAVFSSTRDSANNSGRRQLVIPSLLIVLSAIALPSCGSPPSPLVHNSLKSAAPPRVSQAVAPGAMPPQDRAAQGSAQAPKPQPQLIKRAELTVVVKSIDQSVQAVSKIVEKQQGDLLGFQDYKPQDNSIRHTASMQMRVPQQRLETTLDELAKLGTVQNRSLTAEDVSAQLVDNEARLRNLRKSEEMVLKIMERSGSVGDVLKASQELSKIRENIERIDAQLKSLQNQVSYSNISMTLQAAIAAAPAQDRPIDLRLQETWGKATHSFNEFTLGLLEWSIRLFVFTPYLLLLGGGALFAYNRIKKQKSQKSEGVEIAQLPSVPESGVRNRDTQEW